jgi:hypothetical protein
MAAGGISKYRQKFDLTRVLKNENVNSVKMETHVAEGAGPMGRKKTMQICKS